MATLNRTITTGDDDANESGGTPALNSLTLNANAATDYIGLRFQNITIPPGSTINSAIFQANITNNSFDDPDLTLYADDSDNAAAHTTTTNDISGRTPTTATVQWVASSLGTGYKNSPDIKTIIQEIISRPGWTSGNAIALIAKGNSSSSAFRIKAFNSGGGDYSNLNIDYTEPGSGGGQPPRTLHQFRMRRAAL